jgi:uncharacterized protein YkwD
MHRRATSLIAAAAVTAAVIVAPAVSTPVALAASHGSRPAAKCHHAHQRHCSRVSTRRVVAHAASAHPMWSFSQGHGSTAPIGSAASAPPPAKAKAPAPPAPTSSGPCANAGVIPTSENIPQVAAAILCLVNQQRAQNGESPLRDNPDLDSSATHHSQDMVAANYFDHTSPTGETPLDRIQASGYLAAGNAYEIGENIDYGQLYLATPSETVSAWMSSPGHRENILNADYVDSGVGVVAQVPAEAGSGEAGATYTQEFGAVETAAGTIS